MENVTAWKVEIAEAVLELRSRGELLTIASIASQVRRRGAEAATAPGQTDCAIAALLAEPDLGEVGDMSDAF